MTHSLSPGDVQGVIFDMDGLLFDTEIEWLECYLESAKELGIKQDIYTTCISAIGRTEEDTKQIFLKEFGQDFPLERMEAKTITRRKVRREKYGIPIKNGAVELINMLQTKEVPYAIASSSYNKDIQYNLTQTKIDHLFEHIIGGDQVSQGKPHPEIFVKAAELINVEPSNCIIFEDSINGLLAAQRAGGIPILIPDVVEHPNESRDRAHKVFSSLLEAQKYLEEIL